MGMAAVEAASKAAAARIGASIIRISTSGRVNAESEKPRGIETRETTLGSLYAL
jgi:hypothetical protein